MRLTSVSLALLLAAACGGAQDDTSTTPAAPAETMPAEPAAAPEATPAETAPEAAATPEAAPAPEPMPAAPTMTDAQIAGGMEMGMKAEMDMAKLGAKKAKNPEVKKFAKAMVKDSTAWMKTAKKTYKTASITPEMGEGNSEMMTAFNETMDKLKGLKGAEFDAAFMEAQVKFHEMGLEQESKMMDGIQNPELKSFADTVKTGCQAHLDQAKTIQSSLSTPAEK